MSIQHSTTALDVQRRKFILLVLRYLLMSIIHLIKAYLTPVASGAADKCLSLPWKSCKYFQRSEIKPAGRNILEQELLNQLAIFIVTKLSHLTPLQYGLRVLPTLKSIQKHCKKLNAVLAALSRTAKRMT